MADQILSQEEIDALLSAMAKGEVDLEGEKKEEEEVKPYDLTSQSVMLRDQFFALEEIYDKFANSLKGALSTTLQGAIEVDFVSTEMIKFGDFLKGFSNPTSYNIFTMEPLIGSALLAVEAKLVFSLIDCMFGGDGKPIPQIREFTKIEQRMIGKFAVQVLKHLENAWSAVYAVNLTLRKSETKSEFVHLVSPNELVIVITFSIGGSGFSGNIYFCISYLMLEPIKERLSSQYLRERDLAHSWNEQLQNLLRDTELNLVAELGRTRLTVRDILNLRVQDVIKLNTGPQDLITIHVEEAPKYRGFPGIVRGNRAIQITTMMRQNGGAQSHDFTGRK